MSRRVAREMTPDAPEPSTSCSWSASHAMGCAATLGRVQKGLPAHANHASRGSVSNARGNCSSALAETRINSSAVALLIELGKARSRLPANASFCRRGR